MAWEWSHSGEAYEAARKNIEKQPREWLETVWAEWVASVPRQFSEADLDLRRFHTAMFRAKRKSDDQLIDFIWEKTEKHATCDNGGFLAHCCPFGCSSHKVAFDEEVEFGGLEVGKRFRFRDSNKKFEKTAPSEYAEVRWDETLGDEYVGVGDLVVPV